MSRFQLKNFLRYFSNFEGTEHLQLITCCLFLVAPEEPFDGRSLYDRLKEQRDAKQEEFEESKKFKNLIKGLDDDDVEHLTEQDNRKILEERKRNEEDQKELNEFRARVAELHEASADQKLQEIASKSKSKVASTNSRFTSQKSILASVVKRKSDTVSNQPPEKRQSVQHPSALVSCSIYFQVSFFKVFFSTFKKCTAVLPGIGDYKSSDDSDASSDELEEVARTDLTGRQLIKKKAHDE